MDPTIMQLLQMYQGSHQGQMYPGISQSGGMFGAQPPTGQQTQIGQPQPTGQDPSAQQHHHGGLNPLMALSPFGALMATHPKYGLAMLSPGIGIANLLGAFK